MIIALIVVIYILYKIVMYILEVNAREPFLITGEWDGYSQSEKKSGNILMKSDTGIEQSYQFWIYIDDYSYRFSHPKHIFHVGTEDATIASPSVWLFPKNSNISIRFDTFDDLKNINETITGIECQNWTSTDPHDTSEYTETLYPDADLGNHNYCRNPDNRPEGPWCFTTDPDIKTEVCGTQNMSPIGKTNMSVKQCDITDVPIQRWVHFAIVLFNKTIDVYMNGKLERSCTLEKIPRIHFGNIYLTNYNGFGGKIYNLQYLNRILSQEEIYHLYKIGKNGLDWWTSLLSMIPTVSVSVEVEFANESP